MEYLFSYKKEWSRYTFYNICDPWNWYTKWKKPGWAWWLRPGRPRWVDLLRPGVWDQPDQHNKTPSPLKIQNLASHGGVCLKSQLLGRLRQENHLNLGGGGCSALRLPHWTPGAWATRAKLHLKNKHEKQATYVMWNSLTYCAIAKTSRILCSIPTETRYP